MNPAALQKLARCGVYPIRNIGILMRKSSFYRRDIFSIVSGRKAHNNMQLTVEISRRIMSPSTMRHISSEVKSANSNTGMIMFGVASALGMGAGIYFLSSNLKDSVIFKKSIDVMNSCPLVIKCLGSSIKSTSLVRGSVKDGVANLHFIIRGDNGEFLVSLIGSYDKESGDCSYETLSIHERAHLPVVEYYIFHDGVYATNDCENGAAENIEESIVI